MRNKMFYVKLTPTTRQIIDECLPILRARGVPLHKEGGVPSIRTHFSIDFDEDGDVELIVETRRSLRRGIDMRDEATLLTCQRFRKIMEGLAHE